MRVGYIWSLVGESGANEEERWVGVTGGGRCRMKRGGSLKPRGPKERNASERVVDMIGTMMVA